MICKQIATYSLTHIHAFTNFYPQFNSFLEFLLDPFSFKEDWSTVPHSFFNKRQSGASTEKNTSYKKLHCYCEAESNQVSINNLCNVYIHQMRNDLERKNVTFHDNITHYYTPIHFRVGNMLSIHYTVDREQTR